MKKLLILGIGSLTGCKIPKFAKNNYEIWGSFNLRDPKIDNVNSVKFEFSKDSKIEKLINEISPDIIINCTALNNVDYCENHQLEAQQINYNRKKNWLKLRVRRFGNPQIQSQKVNALKNELEILKNELKKRDEIIMEQIKVIMDLAKKLK